MVLFKRLYLVCHKVLHWANPFQFLYKWFFFITQATLYNYADDNTLAYFSITKPDFVATLEKETGVALSWLKQSEMISNPETFHAILLRKNQTSTSWQKISIDGEIIKPEETVKPLGVTLDYRLHFDSHISNICKNAATQLNVLQRLKSFIGFKEKTILVQSFMFFLWKMHLESKHNACLLLKRNFEILFSYLWTRYSILIS